MKREGGGREKDKEGRSSCVKEKKRKKEKERERGREREKGMQKETKWQRGPSLKFMIYYLLKFK